MKYYVIWLKCLQTSRITWINFDQRLSRRMASPGYNELSRAPLVQTISHSTNICLVIKIKHCLAVWSYDYRDVDFVLWILNSSHHIHDISFVAYTLKLVLFFVDGAKTDKVYLCLS